MMQRCPTTKLCLVQQLKKFLVILLVLVLIFFLYVSFNFNLTEFAFMPGPLSALTERVKSIAKTKGNVNGSDVNKTRYRQTGPRYRLVDLPRVKPNTLSSNVTNRFHEILWYNQPGWVNIYAGSLSLRNQCAYKNCYMTNHHGNLSEKSVIVFTLTEPLATHPPVVKRPLDQVWVAFWAEPPGYIDRLSYGRLGYRHKAWQNVINWTMSYRTDSDILYPYGALISMKIPLRKNYDEIYNRKHKTATWFVSNCYYDSGRRDYVNELLHHGIDIDIYGRCGKDGRRLSEHALLEKLNKDYKFYLSFENSICEDYITEKFFRNYNSDVVLVVRGGAKYANLLPPQTYINCNDFNSSYSLAMYLKYVASNKEVYTKYLKEKDKYTAVQMPQMTNSFCRICEKLNNLEDHRKTIDDLIPVLHDKQCRNPQDLNVYHRIIGYFTLLNIAVIIIGSLVILYCLSVICKRSRN